MSPTTYSPPFHWPFTAAQAAIEHAHARACRKRRGNRAPNPAAAAEHHHALVCELEIHARVLINRL